MIDMVKIEEHVEEESHEPAQQSEGSSVSDVVSSRRKRVRTSKYKDYVSDQTNGYCPGCNKYVEYNQEGVLCVECASYWHFECANVSAKEVEQLGNQPFYCESHRKNDVDVKKLQGVEVLVSAHAVQCDEVNNESFEESVVDVKVAQYILNNTKYCNDKLKCLDNQHEIKKLDQGKQFTVNVNSVTYFVIVKSLSALGKSQGVNIKRKGVDLMGTSTQAQFDVDLQVGDLVVPITMTCFHTTNKIHVQVKGKKREAHWSDKLLAVEQFVYGNVVAMINKVESMPTYNDIRTSIVNDLSISAGLGEVKSVNPNRTEKLFASGLSSELDVCEHGSPADGHVQALVEEDQPISDGSEVNSVELISDSNLSQTWCSVSQNGVDNNKIIGSNISTAPSVHVVSCDSAGALKDVVPVVSEDIVTTSVDKLNHDQSKTTIVKKHVENRNNKQLQQALGVIRSENDENMRVKALYSIILQLKSKGLEVKNEYEVIHQPQYSDNLNRVTLMLFEKQKEVDSLKKQSKELELQIKDLKKCKVENEKDLIDMKKREKEKDKMIQDIKNEYSILQEKVGSAHETGDSGKDVELAKKCNEEQLAKISELENFVQEKDQCITELQKCNSDLVKRCQSLSSNEVELSTRIHALEAVSSHIDEGKKGDIVVVHAASVKENSNAISEEVASLNQRLDRLNRDNSLMKDELAEKTVSLQKIDEFYKEIVDQKDKVILDLQSITSDDGNIDIKFKRLLLKFRSEQELKLMNELKTSIDASSDSANKVATTDIGINTDFVPNPCKCKHNGNDESSTILNDGASGLNGASKIGNIQKPKMCKFGLLCDRKEFCEYSHEIIQKTCRFGNRCTKGNACLFLHRRSNDGGSTTGGEKYEERNHPLGGMSASAPINNRAREPELINGFLTLNQAYANVVGDKFVPQRQGFSSGVPGMTNPCYSNTCGISGMQMYHNSHGGFTDNNMLRRDGNSHSPVLNISGHERGNTKLCRNGRMCSVNGCGLRHEIINKTCKFGGGCSRKDTCLFRHDIQQNTSTIPGSSQKT